MLVFVLKKNVDLARRWRFSCRLLMEGKVAVDLVAENVRQLTQLLLKMLLLFLVDLVQLQLFLLGLLLLPLSCGKWKDVRRRRPGRRRRGEQVRRSPQLIV